jgi:uncharacterized protein (DUF1778 family)
LEERLAPRQARKAFRKLERLEARLTREQKRTIERAARIRGTSITDFVLSSVQRAAADTIESFERLRLRDRARDVFVNALLNPPAPDRAARAAAQRYKERAVIAGERDGDISL